MKRLLMYHCIFGTFSCICSTRNDLRADKVIDEKLGVPIVVYGADLSEAERESVKKV